VNTLDSGAERPPANVTIVSPTHISPCFDVSLVQYSSGGDGLVRYKTAAIWSAVLVVVTAGMFALPAAVWAVFLPSLKQALPDPIPGYERVLLEVAVFCGRVKWMLAILALPIIGALFTVAEFTSQAQVRKARTATPAPNSRPPALWNPSAGACWSLLFTPAFGAFLHAWNANAMGRHSEAEANKVWFYVIIVYFGFTLMPIRFIPELFFTLAPIGLLWGWYFCLGKDQIKYVNETWGYSYERKPWTKPLITALCCLGTFIVLTVAAKLLLGLRWIFGFWAKWPYSKSRSEIWRKRFPQPSWRGAAVKISVEGLRMKVSAGCLQ
jgi:hypothetical protein